ncbi:MAG TPA: hypothetical protein DCY93_01205 [Firmicutes bacterium]|nr:hypothetical protein [Bacillota bacterium]
MKKKINILAHICMLCTTLSLASCGGGKSNDIDVSMAKFTDEGIGGIEFYAGSKTEYDNRDKDAPLENILKSKGNLYSSWEEGNEFKTVELEKDEWIGVVSIYCNQGYEIGDLKLEVNNKELEFVSIDGMFNSNYFTIIDEAITDDIQLKIKGKSQVSTFRPTVNLQDYETCQSGQVCQDLRFKVGVGTIGGESITYKPFEYKSKTEFTAPEFKEAMENTSFSFFEMVKVTAYFKDKAKFFPNYNDITNFIDASNLMVSDDWELSWYFQHSDNGGVRPEVTLAYSVFSNIDAEKMSNISLSCKSFVSFSNTHVDENYVTRFEDGSYKFIVDNVEKDKLTLAELNSCKNLKIKLEVTQLMATIMKDDTVKVSVGDIDDDWGNEELWNGKTFQKNELVLSNEQVPGKPGYYYLTLDLGNLKTSKNQNSYLDICIHVDVERDNFDVNEILANEIEGLNKVEFVFDDSSSYGGHRLSPFRNNVNQLDIVGNGESGSRSMGCYYLDNTDLEVEIDDIAFTQNHCNKLKLTITKADSTVEEIMLNYVPSDLNSTGVWEKDPSDTHSLVTVEYVERNSPDFGTSMINKLTIKKDFGTVTKIETTLVDWTEY